MPSGLTKYGSIGRVTYYADVVKNQDKEFGRGAFAEAFKKAGIETSKKQFSLSKEHSDDLPIRSDIYGKDIALDIPIRDDIAPVQERADVGDIPIRDDLPTQSSKDGVWDMSEESMEDYMAKGNPEDVE